MSEITHLKAENAKLREELAKWERLAAGIDLPEYPVTQFKPKDLERENAKLRELVRDICGMACFECNPWADSFACVHWDGECRIRERMAALGIEVW